MISYMLDMPSTALYLSDETLDALRTQASKLDVSCSALADLCIRITLKKSSENALLGWAESKRSSKAKSDARSSISKGMFTKLKKYALVTLTKCGSEWVSFETLTNQYDAESRDLFACALNGLLTDGRVERSDGDMWRIVLRSTRSTP